MVGDAAGMSWIEARDVAKYPIITGQSLQQRIVSARIEKPCPR